MSLVEYNRSLTVHMMVKCGVVLFLLVLSLTPAWAQSPVPPGASVELVQGGFQFTEGPLWKDGVGLFFSDQTANITYKWTTDSGAVAYVRNTNGGNGLTWDLEGNLIMAQQAGRTVSRVDSNRIKTVIADSFRLKKLNSPNDVVVKSDGAIFFTDPPFGVSGPQKELPWSGIFRISPSGVLQLLDSTLALPNGLAFSPDESKLYVNDSQIRRIYVWDVVNDSTLANKHLFASIPSPSGYADGMKVDPAGNLYSAAPLGIWVFSPAGTLLDTILVPGSPTNCAWGDADHKTLYITSSQSVYRVRMSLTGVEEQHSALPPGRGPTLVAAYPNPFNPTATVQYSLPSAGHITLEVLDVLGRHIVSLVDRNEQAGLHTATWDATGKASGRYFVRMTAGERTMVKSLVLIR